MSLSLCISVQQPQIPPVAKERALRCSNGLIWYSARCWLLFWYARQSVLMEDDCSRVWRQFDGLWMRAHSVPLTAQDNALCSPLTISHNLAQHNTAHWTASHNIRIYSCSSLCMKEHSLASFMLFLYVWKKNKKQQQFQKVTSWF